MSKNILAYIKYFTHLSQTILVRKFFDFPETIIFRFNSGTKPHICGRISGIKSDIVLIKKMTQDYLLVINVEAMLFNCIVLWQEQNYLKIREIAKVAVKFRLWN